MTDNPYATGLDKTPANYQPLTPLGLLEREIPVDALPGRLQSVLQLADQLGDHLGVARQARGPRQTAGIDLAVPREELAQHVAELVLGSVLVAAVARGVSHAIHATPDRAVEHVFRLG